MINQPPNIVNMKFGSHLYELNTPTSDIDWKGIYLPELPNLLLGNYGKTFKYSTGGKHEKNKPGDEDYEVISLPRFIEFAIKGETLALDMLHANTVDLGYYGWIWEDLVSQRTNFYSKNLKAFVGYVKRQAAKYGVKGSRLAVLEEIYATVANYAMVDTYNTVGELLDRNILPTDSEHIEILEDNNSAGYQKFYVVCGRKFQTTLKLLPFMSALQAIYDGYGQRAQEAKDNKGVDWKAMSHALRAGYQARDIYRDGDFSYPLAETKFLLDVKQGKLDFLTQVSPILEELVEEVNELADNSNLPAKVNSNYWDIWLLSIYDEVYNYGKGG